MSNLTCQCAGMSEGSNLRISESSQQRDHIVHHVLVVDDAILTLTYQNHNEVTEVRTELLPLWTTHD